MELTFEKNGKQYEVEVKVYGDYALHLEKEKNGKFAMEQRSTAAGNFAECVIPYPIERGLWRTVDYVFGHGYYPMSVRFISDVPITKAELNQVSNG